MSEATDPFGLAGKVAAVTGGGGVLCSCMAVALGKAGAKVAVLDLIEDAAKKTADAIVEAGGQAIPVACNVLEKESIEAACSAIVDAFGTVDMLINGAGGNKKEATTSEELSFFDLPADAVRWVFELNCLGTILPCQVFGKLMAEAGTGCIINISSMNAFRPLTRVPAYSAAKSAISNFTAWLSVHMNHNYSKDIRVNALAPGFFLTEQNRFLLTDADSGELTPRGKAIIDHTPMDRFGKPEDLVGAVLWLGSPGAEFVNGITLPIDGGFSAFSGV